MPLHVETNEPASEEDLRAVEAALGGPLPAVLRAFLRRHDGLQTYAEDAPLGWVVHGTTASRIRRDGALLRSPDAEDYLGYIRDDYAAKAPLVAETESFTDWLGALRYEGEHAFPRDHVCVAAHWVHHGSCWLPLRDDATELLFVPSPRFADGDAIAEAVSAPRISFESFVAHLLVGDEPL